LLEGSIGIIVSLVVSDQYVSTNEPYRIANGKQRETSHMLREEIKSIKSDKSDLRKFGLMIGSVLLLLSAFLFWKAKSSAVYFGIIGGTLMVAGLILPGVLKPVFRAWMAFAVVMGFVMTRVILTVLYFGMFTPIALVLRLLGKDLLEEQWDKNAGTYWLKRKPEPYDPASTERMF